MATNNLNLRCLKKGSYSPYAMGYPERLVKKWKRQRVTRGFSDWDAYDLDAFYLQLIPASLRHLAKNSHGYSPEIANSFEEWISILNNLADDFDKLYEMFDNDITFEGEKKCEEFSRLKNDVFKRFGDIFFSLWD